MGAKLSSPPFITGGTAGDIIYFMINYTTFLAHFNGATGDKPNAETGQVLTYVSGAAVSSVQKKFGTGSLLLNGTSDYVTAPISGDWNFGTGDFTIDIHVYFVSIGGIQRAILDTGSYTAATGLTMILSDAPYAINVYIAGGAAKLSTSWTPSLNTWYHVRLTRLSGVLHIYIDGVELGTGTANADNIQSGSNTLKIGYSTASTGFYMNGYLDELRASKVARCSGNFTPPAAEYPVSDPGGLTRLPIGSSGQLLKVSAGGIPYWG